MSMAANMITYFVHSTSVDNEAGVRSGWKDPPLSAIGKGQAEELGKSVAGRRFDLVASSDLRRARETAEIAFPGIEVQRDARLREMNYGALNGKHGSAFPRDDLWCIGNRFVGGECCLDVQARVRDFLDSVVGARIAIVAHKYPQLALEVLCNGLTWSAAIESDWRRWNRWQPGWTYAVPPSGG